METNIINHKYPDTDEIESEVAKFLYEQHCAILIVENLPIGSEFGIDMSAHRIGEKFKGVKMIPPGIHFIYASAIDKDIKHSGPRCGFFYEFHRKEIVIKRWSSSEEDFDDSFKASEDEMGRYKYNLRDLDPYLGAYRFSLYKSYTNLTYRLTTEIMTELMPQCNRIRSVPFLTRKESNLGEHKTRRCGTSSDGENLLPDLQPDRETVIHFTNIPTDHSDLKQPISNEMITQFYLDTSMKLNCIFPTERGKNRLLAEFQFAFITFLLCHVFSCFEHWKDLLRLVCKADTFISAYPTFYCEFIKILELQLVQVPEDLFEDIVDSNNLVRSMLDILFQNINDCPTATDNLITAASRLRSKLENKFGWRFELEPEDEQPVLVDT